MLAIKPTNVPAGYLRGCLEGFVSALSKSMDDPLRIRLRFHGAFDRSPRNEQVRIDKGKTMLSFVEVAPRDGLQNVQAIWPIGDKLSLIDRLVAAGARRIEVASFVHPGRVPQMADAERVVASLKANDGVSYIGLVLNKRGALRALDTGVSEVGIVCAASDTFAQKNQGMTADDTVAEAGKIIELCKLAGRMVQVTISVAFACPFEGAVGPDRVIAMARMLAGFGPFEIALADTIGTATPAHVEALVDAVRKEISPLPLRVHFHDTNRMAVANCWAAYRAGAEVFDASIAGLGGCPFAPGAAGNVASEDVEYLFQNSGIDLRLDRVRLRKTAEWVIGQLSENTG